MAKESAQRSRLRDYRRRRTAVRRSVSAFECSVRVRAWINVTYSNWFEFLSSRPEMDEVNFWQAGGRQRFGRLEPGELFLFKLASPRNFIVGGGVFAYADLLPLGLAWQTFEEANGANSLADLRRDIEAIRGGRIDDKDKIGCIFLTQVFFLPRARWITYEREWPRISYGGVRVDLAEESGRALYGKLQSALARGAVDAQPMLARDLPEDPGERYGEPTLIRPRLGQRSFRMFVTEAYERRCAVTGEKVIPALDAAQIRPYKSLGPHRIQNGILLRRDLHALFDRGYLTIDVHQRVEVSRRIHEEFDNGRDYYALRGVQLRATPNPVNRPGRDFIVWHNENVYRG